jgi:hypothetical protein
MGESRNGPHPRVEHPGSEGTRAAIPCRSLKRGLASFWTTGRLHQPEPLRRLANGLAPFVKLREWSGTRSNQSATSFDELAVKLRKAAVLDFCSQNSRILSVRSIQPIAAFHRDLRYAEDLHRADMAWALHAARRGLSAHEICAQIFSARDLSKKGPYRRQLDYARRTATKAVTLDAANSDRFEKWIAPFPGSKSPRKIEDDGQRTPD